MTKLYVIKIGGSVITDKTSETPKINYDNLKKVAQEISKVYSSDIQLIIIHGAGSYGHPIVKQTGIHEGITRDDQKHAFAKTQALQNYLNANVSRTLIESGIPAIPCQASASSIMKNKKLISIHTESIRGFLDVGLVPVLYGVPSYDKEIGCSILSGDVIAPYLAKEFKAEKIIHVTDVNGIFSGDPKLDETAEHIPYVNNENIEEVLEGLSGSSNTDVTGGMEEKLRNLLDYGIDSQIIGYDIEGAIGKAIEGKPVGTTIKV